MNNTNNLNTNISINKNDFIIASFSSINIRNKDNKNNRENVVVSIVSYNIGIDYEKVDNNIRQMHNIEEASLKKYLIIEIGNDFNDLSKIIYNGKFIKVIRINIYSFLKSFVNKFYNILENAAIKLNQRGDVENNKDYLKKNKINKNLLSNFKFIIKLKMWCLEEFSEMNINELGKEFEVLFIFNRIRWSNVVYMFRIFNISIFGGSTTLRHLLSTVEYNLSMFLFFICDFRQDLVNKILFESRNNISILDKKIEKDINLNSQISHEKAYELIKESFLEKNISNDYRELKSFKHYMYSNFLIESVLESRKILNEIYVLKLEEKNIIDLINEDIERSKSYSGDNSKFGLKKFKASNNRINLNTEKKNTILIEIQKKEEYREKIIQRLYDFKKELFNEEGICILDDSMIINKKIISSSSNLSLTSTSSLTSKSILSVNESSELDDNNTYKENINVATSTNNFTASTSSFSSSSLINNKNVNGNTNNFTQKRKMSRLISHSNLSNELDVKTKISKQMSVYFKEIRDVLCQTDLSNKDKQLKIENM